MANKQISELTAATQVNNADLFVLEQGGVAKKLTGYLLLATIEAHGGIVSTSYTAPVAPSLQGTLTLTYADGTSDSVPIYNGAKGDQGNDGAAGYSPVATVTKSGNIATITITDENGTTSASVTDGQNGQNGADGNPGYCWFKWAADEPTSDADLSDVPDAWLGIYSGTSSTAPTAYTAYAWYKIKGETGATGATGNRGSCIWQATAEPTQVENKYYITNANIAISNGQIGTPQRGDLIWYKDTYYYVLQYNTVRLAYELTRGYTFDTANVPSGGYTDYRLAKASDADYDIKWVSPEVFHATFNSTSSSQIVSAAKAKKSVILDIENNSVYGRTSLTYLPLVGVTVVEDMTDPTLPLTTSRVAAFAAATISGDVFWATATWTLGSLSDTWTSGIISASGGTPYDSNPAMDGTAAAGSSTAYARGDHVHPSDTSRQAKITASGILKGDGNGGVTAAVEGTDYLASAPVTSVNGQTGAVSLSIPSTAADVGAIAAPSSPSDGQFLVYSSSQSAWVAQTVPNANGVNF